jgi:hypothetical protein
MIDLRNRKILTVQFSDRDRHPAELAGMVMYSRCLALLPTDRHHLEPLILVDQIARVKIRTPMQISLKRGGF